MVIFTAKVFALRKVGKILLAIFLCLLILICTLLAWINTNAGQNWLVHKVTAKLSTDLKSRISINHVSLRFFNKMNLEGVMVEDQNKDTLLSAGVVQVRITDWFFLKDKADLNYVGLEDAVVHLNRTDSVWNYQFLADYFSSPSTGSKKSSGLEINLRKAELHRVSFIQHDAWVGQDMIANIGDMELDANDISLTQKIIDVNSIRLVKPIFHLYSYKGNKPKADSATKKKTTPSTDTSSSWLVKLANLQIEDGIFRHDADSMTTSLSYFDGQHILFSQINGTFKNVVTNADTLTANVSLSTRERSGLVVQSLKADMRLHPQLMEFSNLYLKTNRSELGHYFAMKYPSINSMSNFIHAVIMDADFSNSTVSSDDIAFFAPAVKTWKKNLSIEGKVKGTVDALIGKDVHLKAGANTSLDGDFSILGLPDVNSAFIAVVARNFKTTYADAAAFIPAIKKVTAVNLPQLNRVQFAGNFTGFINDFVTYGTVQTGLGTVVTDINMKLPANADPIYSGTIHTTNFQLGKFLKNPQLGVIAFNGKVKGQSFVWNRLNMTLDGKIDKIYFNDYTYQNITANGILKNRLFNGIFDSKDPNAVVHLNGLIDLSKEKPIFNANATIGFLNLQALNLTGDPFTLKGDFDLSFNGSSLSDFLGNASIHNATLMLNEKQLSFDSLVISNTITAGVRTLRARSNQLDATIVGNFDLQTLPDAFTLFLSRYYPSYIKPPRRNMPNQAFTFDINTGVIEDYLQILDPHFSGFNNSHLAGSINVAANSLSLDATVPQLGYQQYLFSDVAIHSKGNLDSLVLAGSIGDTRISDSLHFPQTTFNIKASNDVSDFALNTGANQTINNASLAAQIKTFSNGASVLFSPSSFVINGKTWSLAQGGELDLRKNATVGGQLILKESNQEVRIFTEPSEIGTWNDLHVALQNIKLGDFTPFFIKTDRIDGLLSGNIHVEDPQKRFNVTTDFRLDSLQFDNDTLGTIQAQLGYNNNSGLLTGNGANTDALHKLSFDLAMDFKDSASAHQDRITLNMENYSAKILERFLGSLFSDIQGYLTGKLDILGEGADRDYIAKATLKDAALRVNFTQVFYKIDDTEIELTKDAIELGTIKIRDTVTNNTATVRGNIKHKSFRNMVFDIVAEVDDEPMQLLSTTYADNQQFYGQAKGTGSLILVGPQNDMFMQINAKASERDSSKITLPPAQNRASGPASFMVERKYGREMTGEDYAGAANNITYEIDLTANPRVEVEVQLDPLTGDVIRGRGVGNLRMRAGTSEPLTMRGRYDIQEGSYLFTFQSVFKKPFELRPTANNYIEWTGDPYTAQMHIEAVYKAEKVSLAPLISSLPIDQTKQSSLATYRGDVNVVAELTGELFKPAFDFKIEFPQNFYTSIKDQTVSFALEQGIQQIEKNTNELNKQVTYLILFNSFAPYESQNATVNPFNELAYSTISGLLFSEVNKRLNQLLGKVLRNNDISVNFTGALYNKDYLNPSARNLLPNTSAVNLTIGKSFLNERVLLTLGGSFNVPLAADFQQTAELFKDVTVEFLINKSGSIRATVFYRETPDILSGTTNVGSLRTQRAGANVSYNREFNSLSEIFFGRKKAKRKATPPPPQDTTVTGSK